MRKSVYSTKLSSAECRERLKAHVLPWSEVVRASFSPMSKGTVVARVEGDRFRLFAWGPGKLQNPFAPFFYGKVEATREGTRIVGRFRSHTYVRVVLYAGFGVLTLMAAVLLAFALWGPVDAEKPPFFVMAVPLLMILFGLGFVSFCRWLARGQVDRLHEFLRVDLKATPEGGSDQDHPTSRTGGSRLSRLFDGNVIRR